MRRRIVAMSVPDEYICIASRATSRQTPQPMPCGSHAVTRPCASRADTKQSSLLRWPRCSQPQKQGTRLRTSGWRAANVKIACTTSGGRAMAKSVAGSAGRSAGISARGGSGERSFEGVDCAGSGARVHAVAAIKAHARSDVVHRSGGLDIGQS
jgi:hypothetical protein